MIGRSVIITSFLCALPFLCDAFDAETITVGTNSFLNIKYFATNCYNIETGEHTNEFWTYLNPSTPDWRNPDAKGYPDPEGNLWWEGNDVPVYSDATKVAFSLHIAENADSAGAEQLVGYLSVEENHNPEYQLLTEAFPCYKTSMDEKRVDFFNGWECYRLYVCSTVPHFVTDVSASSEQVTLKLGQDGFIDFFPAGPYQQMFSGLQNQLSNANDQIAFIPDYMQSFSDMNGNTNSFVAEVSGNGEDDLFWTVKGILSVPNLAKELDKAYNHDGTIYGDAQFPQSATIVTYVGYEKLKRQDYSKIDIYNSGFQQALPTSSDCPTQKVLGTASAGIATAGALGSAVPVHGTAVGAVAGLASGILGVVSIFVC